MTKVNQTSDRVYTVFGKIAAFLALYIYKLDYNDIANFTDQEVEDLQTLLGKYSKQCVFGTKDGALRFLTDVLIDLAREREKRYEICRQTE